MSGWRIFPAVGYRSGWRHRFCCMRLTLWPATATRLRV
nr:MAG TPA: hypothetical protein [Caudoviricetes sp.]